MDRHRPGVPSCVRCDIEALALSCGRSNGMNVRNCCRLAVIRHLVDVSN